MDINLADVLTTEYLGQSKLVNEVVPVVTVGVITYQHEPYIRDCLDSILTQKTTFDFEILIGEDNSSDQTREICKEYAEIYPDKIRLFLRRPADKIDVEGRKTWHFNFLATLYAARGKYVAWCDGDDFWTDPNKLQKQYDSFVAYPNCSLIHHHFDKVFPDGTRIPTKVSPPIESTTADVIDAFQIRMSTMMFKNVFQENPLPAWFTKNQVGDVTLSIYLSLFGNIRYLKDNMAVYRVESNSSVLAGVQNIRHLHGAKMYSYLLEDEAFSSHKNTLRRRVLVFLRRFLLGKVEQDQDRVETKSWYGRVYKNIKPKTRSDINEHLRFKAKYALRNTKIRTS